MADTKIPLKFLKGLSTNLSLSTVPYEEGRIYYCTDTNKLYIDFNNERNLINVTDNATINADGLMSSEDKNKLNYTNIAYGTCSTAAATAAKVIEINSNTQWVLTTGSTIIINFSATNTAANPTFNVNGTGAYPIWYDTAAVTGGNSYGGYANRPAIYTFNGTHYVFMGWSYDANTTYTNVKLGQGYGTCSTEAATVAKVASLSGYTLITGGIVSVRFAYDVPANATLNINSKGAKAIYYKNAKITDGVIKAGDTATFIYSSYYRLIAIDRWQEDINSLSNDKMDKVNPTGSGSFSMGRLADSIIGENSHAEGIDVTASGTGSHAEGYKTKATSNYNHAEGRECIADGAYGSHAEGWGTHTKYWSAHAEGYETIAHNFASHAEGDGTEAIGPQSHSEGKYSIAGGDHSHAEGEYTISAGKGSHVEGFNEKKNIKLDYSSKTSFDNDTVFRYTYTSFSDSAGIGDYIFYNDVWHGSLKAQILGIDKTNKYVYCDADLETQEEEYIVISNGAYGDYSHSEGSSFATGKYAHSEGEGTIAYGETSHTEGYENLAIGRGSHVEGMWNMAYGDWSHAEGGNMHKITQLTVSAEANSTTVTIIDDNWLAIPIMVNDVISYGNVLATIIAIDNVAKTFITDIPLSYTALNTVTVRLFCGAVGIGSHTEGLSTRALGDYSHAEGVGAIASSRGAHAENTGIAGGMYSHAEGSSTANKNYSHAEGQSTIADGVSQHVQGKYNVTDSISAHIVGNGSATTPSNAHTLDWDGNAWFAGDVYVGSISGTNKDDGSQKLATEGYVDSSGAKMISAVIPKGRIRGDVDGDGKITNNDSQLILRASLEIIELDEIQEWCADMYTDGIIDGRDANQALIYIDKTNNSYIEYMSDYYGNWTYYPEEDCWMAKIWIDGISPSANAVVSIEKSVNATFKKAEIFYGYIGIYAETPPLEDGSCVIIYGRPGDGIATISLNADAKFMKSAAITIPKGRSVGDVNGDGFIDGRDTDLILKHVAGISSFEDEIQLAVADFNGDGSISSGDSADIHSYLNGTIDGADYLWDYYENWEYYNSYWRKIFYVPSLTDEMSAIIHIQGTHPEGAFYEAKHSGNSIELRTHYLPIDDVSAVIAFGEGDGSVVVDVNTYPVEKLDVLIATYDVTPFNELLEAYNKGKMLYCNASGYIYPLTDASSDNRFIFDSCDKDAIYRCVCTSTSGWVETTVDYDSDVFTAVYGTTTFEEVKAAYDSGAMVLCTRSDNSVKYILTGLTTTTAYFMGTGTSSQILYRVYLDTTWHAASFTCAPASHNQAASTVTAGTFAGQVVANSSGQTYSTSLLRNSKLVSTETNPTVNGEICWIYE